MSHHRGRVRGDARLRRVQRADRHQHVRGVRAWKPDAVLTPGNHLPHFFPGVKVEVHRTGSQRILQRMMQELQANIKNVDVVHTSDAGHYVLLKDKKLLMKYTPAGAEALVARAGGRAGAAGAKKARAWETVCCVTSPLFIRKPAQNGIADSTSASAVARIYEDFVDAFVVDESDPEEAAKVEACDIRALVTDTVMTDTVATDTATITTETTQTTTISAEQQAYAAAMTYLTPVVPVGKGDKLTFNNLDQLGKHDLASDDGKFKSKVIPGGEKAPVKPVFRKAINRSVLSGPGLSALTRMFSRAWITASSRVMASTAPLLAV